MIDVIIPAYNSHTTIERTLFSIASQKNVDDLNVYIVNDASENDYSKQVEYFKKYMSIKELKLKNNVGPGLARQFGVDKSNSEYIVFIDSDDVFSSPFSLKVLYENIENNNADVVISSFYEELDDGTRIEHIDDSIWLHGKIYRREFLKKNGIKFNNTYANEDNGFNQLVFLHDSKIATIDEFTYIWLFNENSITRINNHEYSFGGLEGYLYNITWALNIAIEHGCYEPKIAALAFSTLIATYYYYIEFKDNANKDNLIKWAKRIYEISLKYPVQSEEEKMNIWNNHFLCSTDELDLKDKLNPPITLDNFFEKINNCIVENKTMNILVAINDNYVEMLQDMLFSLKLKNDTYLKIFLIYNDLTQTNKNEIEQFIKNVQIGEIIFLKFNIKDIELPINIDYISTETYYRLYAPFMLPNDIDRILYLDADIIVNCDIKELYDTSFENKILIACENSDSANHIYNENLGLPKDNLYVNAGMLLIDIKKYKKFCSIKSLNNFIYENRESLYYQDQDIINKMFFNKIKIVEQKFNFQINYILGIGIDNVEGIIHYSSPLKPWNKDYDDPNRAKYLYNVLEKQKDFKRLNNLKNQHIRLSKKKNVELSIIVPVYNVEKYLDRCLSSISRQIFEDIEVMCIDDGSTDESINICKKYEKEDFRFNVIQQEHQGLSEARNTGLKNAKGRYIAFVDSDDFIDPFMYEDMIHNLKENNLDIVICNFYHLVEKEIFVDNPEGKDRIIKGKQAILKEVLLDKTIKNYVWMKIYKRELFKNIRFPKGKKYEDIAISVKVFERAKKIGYIKEPYYYYCYRDGSIISKNSINNIDDIINNSYKRYKYVNKKYNNIDIYNIYSMMYRIAYEYFRNDVMSDDEFINRYRLIIDDIVKQYYKHEKAINNKFKKFEDEYIDIKTFLEILKNYSKTKIKVL